MGLEAPVAMEPDGMLTIRIFDPDHDSAYGKQTIEHNYDFKNMPGGWRQTEIGGLWINLEYARIYWERQWIFNIVVVKNSQAYQDWVQANRQQHRRTGKIIDEATNENLRRNGDITMQTGPVRPIDPPIPPPHVIRGY